MACVTYLHPRHTITAEIAGRQSSNHIPSLQFVTRIARLFVSRNAISRWLTVYVETLADMQPLMELYVAVAYGSFAKDVCCGRYYYPTPATLL